MIRKEKIAPSKSKCNFDKNGPIIKTSFNKNVKTHRKNYLDIFIIFFIVFIGSVVGFNSIPAGVIV